MAMHPRVLVLDEPAAGLDPEGRDTILSQIRDYDEKTGITVLLVSHSMEDIAKYANRVLVMHRAKIAMYDTVENVFARAQELLELGLSVGMEQAWAAYGQPILDGLAQGWQNVVGIFSALWSEVLQPVLVQLFDLLGALWTAHLQPLWNELTACLGAVTTLLLTLWNTVLAPFVQWLITALAPVAVQVFAALGTAVTGAAGRHHDCTGGAARSGRLFDRRAAGRVGRCLGCDGRDGLNRVGAHRLHCADGGLHGAGRCAQHGRGHCGGHQWAAVGHRTCQKHGGQCAGRRGQAGQQPKCDARAGLRGVGAGPGAGAGGGHPAEPAVFGDAR